MKIRHRVATILGTVCITLGLVLAGTGTALADKNKKGKDAGNIVTAVVSAPVVTNGLVAGEPTEFNVLLNAPLVSDDLALDPDNFGHQIPAGGYMELELSGTYTRNLDAAGDPVVTPIVANRNIILTTGPQNPITATAGTGVQHGNWTVSDDGDRLMTITPAGGSGRNGLENGRAKENGFKIIHVRPNARSGNGPAPFLNGPAGTVGTIAVRIYDGNGKLKESGYGDVVFQASVGRQIHITNAGLTTGGQGSPATTSAELVENTNFQHVAPGTSLTNTGKTVPFSAGAPYATRFLLFEALAGQPDSFIPQIGIANVDYVVDSGTPWVATLVENSSDTIGAVVMSGPSESSRGTILPAPGVTAIGGNGSVLNVPVQVGTEPGVYTVTVTLLGGGQAVNTIIVEKDDDDDDD